MNPIVCCQDLQVRQEIHKLGVLILPRWSTIYRVVYGLGEMSVQDFLNGPQAIRSLKIH